MAKTEQAVPAAQRRKVMRSPNFPAFSLSDALKRVQAIYDKDRRNAVSAAVILEHLGYGKNLSGSAGRVLSGMRQYGLLEDTEGDKYRVSESAFHILTLPEESPRRWEAIVKCATRPVIFKEVLQKYPSELPSDSTLREYLIAERVFNPASVETFIRALKGTIQFAKLYETPYNTGHIDDVPSSEASQEMNTSVQQTESQSSLKPPPAGIAREVFSLEQGEAVLQWPTTLNADGVQDLEDWLALVVKKLKRLKSR